MQVESNNYADMKCREPHLLQIDSSGVLHFISTMQYMSKAWVLCYDNSSIVAHIVFEVNIAINSPISIICGSLVITVWQLSITVVSYVHVRPEREIFQEWSYLATA